MPSLARKISLRFIFIALFLSLLSVSCASEPDGTVVLMAEPGDDPPKIGETPFPSDVWRSDSGTLEALAGLERWFPRGHEIVAAHLGRLDGFGVRPVVEFPLSAPIEPTSVPARTRQLEDAVFVVALGEGLQPAGSVVPYDWRYDPAAPSIVGSPEPGHVLESGRRYAAVATTDILDDAGSPLVRAPALRQLAAVDDGPWKSTAEALREVEGLVSARRIVGLAAFTVQNATAKALAAREVVADRIDDVQLAFPREDWIHAGSDELSDLFGTAPVFGDGPRQGQERWGSATGTGIAHEHVGVVATGKITLARLRRPGGDRPDPDGGTFAIDDSGRPAVQAHEPIPITFVLPAAPAPEAGYPTVFFAHGLGASRHAIVTFAEPLTRAGFAVVAIDADGHGSRYSETDVRNNLGSMLAEFTGVSDRPDGFGDTTGLATTYEFLGGLQNFSAANDGILQSVVDWSQVTLLLKGSAYDLSPLATEAEPNPRLDTRRISFLGESFGTVVGGVLAAVEPEIDVYVLDVPGAGVVDLAIVSSPSMASLLLPLADSLYGMKGRLDRFRPAVHLLQSIVDGADPLTFAPHLLRDRLVVDGKALGPRHVIALEVIGDEAIHNGATEAWARAAGLEVLTPHLYVPDGMSAVESPATGNVDAQTGVLVQYSPATHGLNWAAEWGELEFVPGFPHPEGDPFPRLDEPLAIENPIYATLDQVVEIAETHLTGDAPTVTSTHVPREL